MTAIVGLPLPFQIADGQIADAAPVMGNMNYIAAQVNANASSGGSTVHTDFYVSGAATYPLLIGDTIIGKNSIATGDVLTEWSADANARFTPKVAGNYSVRFNGEISQGGSNVTTLVRFMMSIFKNGASLFDFQDLTWPYASGASVNQIPFCGEIVVPLIVGDFVDIRMTTAAFTGAGISFYGGLGFRQLPPY